MLLISIRAHSRTLEKTALTLFIVSATVIVPVFLLGEEAEERIEHSPRVVESVVENHEEAAEVSLWLGVSLGILSLIALGLGERPQRILVRKFLVALALGTMASVSFTAHQGGKIGHPEAYTSKSDNIDQRPEHEGE